MCKKRNDERNENETKTQKNETNKCFYKELDTNTCYTFQSFSRKVLCVFFPSTSFKYSKLQGQTYLRKAARSISVNEPTNTFLLINCRKFRRQITDFWILSQKTAQQGAATTGTNRWSSTSSFQQMPKSLVSTSSTFWKWS